MSGNLGQMLVSVVSRREPKMLRGSWLVLGLVPDISRKLVLIYCRAYSGKPGRTVVSTGPYHNVRHPTYTAILVFVVGTYFLLGSWYEILLGLILLVMLARRAMLEERALREELPGYAAYMTKVKYRLIPYIW